jgi:hypothetical protein
VIQAVGPGDRLLSISHATWDIDAVHGVHAMYSVNQLCTAVGVLTTQAADRGNLGSEGAAVGLPRPAASMMRQFT